MTETRKLKEMLSQGWKEIQTHAQLELIPDHRYLPECGNNLLYSAL